MTDLKTTLPVILTQTTCHGEQPAKGVQFQSVCNLCRDSHKTQVWLCFLVLSFFSTYISAASVTSQNIKDVQVCFNNLKHAIQNSDAMLYAPSINDVKAECKNMSLKCYMLELMMVIDEEEIVDDNSKCIMYFNQHLSSEANIVGCPRCEAYSLKNVTIFLERLRNLLEERRNNIP